MKIKYIVTLLFFINITSVKAQDNSIFYTYSEIIDTNAKKLSLDIYSTSFLKNNEYFEVIRGWTGIGFFIKPKLVYQPTKTTQIQAGYFFEKYSGRSDFYKPLPLFRIRQKLSKSLEVVMGQLYGNLNHKLYEPMFLFDRYYSDNVEYGIQFLFKNKYIENDLWMNWEKFIFYDDPFKEEFVLGNRMCLKYDFTDRFNLRLPVHYTWTHAGGQIDKHDENRGSIMSLNNKMAGIKLTYRSKLQWLKSISIEYDNFDYKAGANPPEGEKFHQPFDKGYGHYIKSNIDLGRFKFMVGYWNAHNYISKRGENIFASAYDHFPEIQISDRELFNFKFIYDYEIKKGIVFSLRTDLYYRPLTKNMFYSYAFYFVYNDSFLLKRI